MVRRVSTFGSVNRLPPELREQMMASAQLRFSTAEVIQQQLLSDLPTALRSRVAHHLFRDAVQRCYLFQGVSDDLVVRLVSEMRAEYFPPQADIILQKVTSTACYIIVSGSAVSTALSSLYNLIYPCSNTLHPDPAACLLLQDVLTTADDGTEKASQSNTTQ